MGATKMTLDFTNVKDGGQFNKKRLPEGDYRAKITKVGDAKAKKTGDPMWLFTIEVRYKGQTATYPYYCQVAENMLWKIRALFAAAGIVIPKKRVAIDPNRIVGREVGVTLEDTEYNDKLQSQIAFIIPLSEVVGDEQSEEVEEDEEDEETEEEEDTEEEEEETEEEEEEDEEPPAPPVKKKAATAPPAKKTAAKKTTRRAPAPADDDELEELDIEGV